jgi:hypothetical protein
VPGAGWAVVEVQQAVREGPIEVRSVRVFDGEGEARAYFERRLSRVNGERVTASRGVARSHTIEVVPFQVGGPVWGGE